MLLATSHALLVDYPDIEVHFVSFPRLAGNVEAISDYATKISPDAKPITFHALDGKDFGDALNANLASGVEYDPVMPPGLEGVNKLCKDLQSYLMPWTAPEYIQLHEEVLKILDEVDPGLVAMEVFLGPALDAIRAQDRQQVVISPNSLKDNFVPLQPWASALWKYPAYVYHDGLFTLADA